MSDTSSAARAATIPDALALDTLTLIGVYYRGDDTSALVRHPDGTIERVEPGDPLDGGTIVAMSTDSLHLSRGGEVTVLSLPPV